MTIRCEIVSQDRVVYEGDVNMVVIPGVEGEMGILPNHAPVLTTLNFGIITVVTSTDRNYFTVAGGVAEVQPDQVTILADAAENVEELDESRAEKAKQRAEALIGKADSGELDNVEEIQNALRRSTLRLDAIKRFKKTQKFRRFDG